MRFTPPIAGVGKSPKFQITQRFGESKLNYTQFGLKAHNGIDIAAPRGTPIHALHDGWIIEATEKTGGYGIRVTQVFFDNGREYHAVYGHCMKTAFPEEPWNPVLRKYPVKAGDIIAWVNNTGYSSGDHLHLGLYEYKDGQTLNTNNGYRGAIDPEPYIVWDDSEPEEIEMIKRVRSNGTEYLQFNEFFSIGIASEEFANLLTEAKIPIEDATEIAPEKFTLDKLFGIHKK